MIIGIDYRFALNSIRGIGYYIKSVVEELAALDKTNTYYLYVNNDVSIDFPPNFKIVKINCKNLILFEQFYLPRKAKKDKVDVLWYPSNSGPLFLNADIKLIVTIHDLVSLNRKFTIYDLFSFNTIKSLIADKYRGITLKYGLNKINQIIAVSKYTAQQIHYQLKRKARVIYNHIHRFELNNDSQILNALNLQPKNYVYTLTGIAKHKNLATYLKLFKSGVLGKVLVISGVTDKSLMKKHGNQFIVFTGYVSEEEKASLYANASAFLCLSHHEGFGLPILEAMQFHIPIISSDRGALPEIVGDAGLLVNPDDHKQIFQALRNLDHKEFALMREKQEEQISQFSNWSKSAKAHLALFKGKGYEV